MSRQELLGTYLIDIIAMFFAMPQALYPALATIYGEEYLGFFPASLTVGMLVGSLTSGWTRNINRHGICCNCQRGFVGRRDNIFRSVGQHLARARFSRRGWFCRYDFGNFSRRDLESDDSVLSARKIGEYRNDFYLTGPMLGSAKMGFVAERFGVKTAIISGGILCVVGVGILSLFLPKFLTYDGREGIKQKEIEEADTRRIKQSFTRRILEQFMPILKKREIENLEQMTSEELEEFLRKIPAGQYDIEDLFDFLEMKLEKEECNHSSALRDAVYNGKPSRFSETHLVAATKRRLLRLQSYRANRSNLEKSF